MNLLVFQVDILESQPAIDPPRQDWSENSRKCVRIEINHVTVASFPWVKKI